MTNPKQHIYVEQHHTQEEGKLTAFRFVFHYGNAQAEITIMPAEPRPLHLGIPETARLEIHMLLDALEAAAESSSNILLQKSAA
jgi:hypothetical protein